MDLSFVTNDPLDGETFVTERSQGGYYGAGGWSDNYVTMNLFGIISIADARDVEALPDADRVHEVISIHCEQRLYTTRLAAGDGGPATSDLVIYQGPNAPWGKYRVLPVKNYQSRGFWSALATRMAGA
jgi:hypothetical protein